MQKQSYTWQCQYSSFNTFNHTISSLESVVYWFVKGDGHFKNSDWRFVKVLLMYYHLLYWRGSNYENIQIKNMTQTEIIVIYQRTSVSLNLLNMGHLSKQRAVEKKVWIYYNMVIGRAKRNQGLLKAMSTLLWEILLLYSCNN